MSTTLKTYFFLYKAKVNSKGLAPIMFRLRYQQQVVQLAIGYFIKPSNWVQDKNLVKQTDPHATVINKHLKDLEVKSYNIFSKMFQDDVIYLKGILEQIKGKTEEPVSLLKLVHQYNQKLKTRVGTDLMIATYKKYHGTETKLTAFLQSKGKHDLTLKELRINFIDEFNTFMKLHYGNDQNTTCKHLKNLKTYLKYAVAMDWLSKSPFTEFKVSYKAKEKPYLSLEELHRLENKSFDIYRIQLVKDLFLIQCYTGLSFADLAGLNGGNVTSGIDGNLWVIKNRLKTDVRSAIPLLPRALELIVKYNPDFRVAIDKQLLPMYNIQRYNAYLKEIADLCGITKVLSSHAGRRTFASTVALSNGISIESISQMLGHTSTKITQQYAKVNDMKVAVEMEKIKTMYS
jgi:integrase